MKKHTKKAFGLFGLLLVVATTIFAATLPSPEVNAATTSDTLVVRVVGETPHVEFTNLTDDETFLTPVHSFEYIYDNVETVTITLEYTDTDGVTHEYVLESIDADYYPGNGTIDLDLSDPEYGYGDYVIRITGDHQIAASDEDSYSFSYYPFTAEVEEDDETDNANVTLDYDDSTEIERIEIVVLDENGNPVPDLPTITVTPPEKEAVIPFGDNDIPAGTYIIEITSYDEDGEMYTKTIVYVFEPTRVPNTGGLFGMLNVSKEDYLTTGLFVFFLIGLAGVFYIAKANKSSKKR